MGTAHFGLGLMRGAPSPCNTDAIEILTGFSFKSNWVHAAKARHGKSQNPELTSLLLRCERLAQMPLKAHFVFDGGQRPGLKRGRRVQGNEHWSEAPFKAILDVYGYSHSTVRDTLACSVFSGCSTHRGLLLLVIGPR